MKEVEDFRRRIWRFDRGRRLRRAQEDRQRRRRNWMLLLHSVVIACTVDRALWCKYRSGHFWDRVVSREFTPRDFRENFRVNRSTFDYICDELADSIQKRDNRFRLSIPVKKRVAITLWRLSTNCEYRTIGHLFGVAPSTVCIILHETCQAITDGLFQRFISFPKGQRLAEVVEGFEQSGFPQVGGVIDGTHIPIIGPTDYPADYYNRKGWYSIILQAVCDHQYRFTDILVGWPGRCHDARVLANSSLYQRGQNGQLFPNETKEINGVQVPIMILGDPAYPLRPWLMKGFPDNGRLTHEQQYFNQRLSSSRMVIEGAFGRLKGRFRCLLKRCDSSLEHMNTMVVACCILHNMCEMQSDRPDGKWKEVVNEYQPWQPLHRRGRQDQVASPGSATRNALVELFSN